jgi:hypothetical protein
MDAGLLTKVFGSDQQWVGPCTVVMDADASIQTIGSDAIVSAGTKMYSPRLISGRVQADAACLLKDGTAVVTLTQQRTRQQTGEEIIKQTVMVIDPRSVAAVEFAEGAILTSLGLEAPVIRTPSGSHPGTGSRPKT